MTFRIPPGIAHTSTPQQEHWLLRVGDEQSVCLSPVGHLVWRACDGAASVEEVIETLVDDNGWAREEVVDSVRAFAADLLHRGYLTEVRE